MSDDFIMDFSCLLMDGIPYMAIGNTAAPGTITNFMSFPYDNILPNNPTNLAAAISFVQPYRDSLMTASDVVSAKVDALSASIFDMNGDFISSKLPSDLMGNVHYKGVWNANTNTPTLASGTGTAGYYYKINVAGTTTIDGNTDWNPGDWIVFNGTTWDKIDNTDKVASFNGRGGDVWPASGDYTKSMVGLGNVDNTADTAKPISTLQQAALDLKVDKVSGKGLSTNDFTSAYKAYLDRVWHDNTTGGSARSIVTSATATGFQISTTVKSDINYDIDLSSTATIAGVGSVAVVLETANTNSTTASDWTEVKRVSNGQSYTLAIAIQGVQTLTVPLIASDLDPTKWYRVRSIISGTASAAIRKANEKY